MASKRGTKRARTSSTKKKVGAGKSSKASSSHGSSLQGSKGEPKDRILPGIIINDPYLEYSDMLKYVVTQGWESFFRLDVVGCRDLIMAFYENLKIEISANRAKLIVKYDNVTKVYSNDDFARDFGILNKGDPSYSSGTMADLEDEERVRKVLSFNNGSYPKGWASPGNGKMVVKSGRSHSVKFAAPHMSCLDGEDYMVFKLVRMGIIPTLNRSSEASRNELEIFLKLKANTKMNLFMLIAHHMKYSISSKGLTLPYGMFVTHIMQKWGLLQGNEDNALKGLIFNEYALSRFGYKVDQEHPMGPRVVKKTIGMARNEEVSRAARSNKGKGKMDDSIGILSEEMSSFRSEMRSGLQVIRKNQGMLANSLNAIMKAIACQGSGKRVNEDSLKEIALFDLENFEEQEEDGNDGSHNDDDGDDGDDGDDNDDGDHYDDDDGEENLSEE